jgi:integrase
MINKQLIEARSELKRLISLKEKAVRHTTEWVEQAQNWLNYLEWKEVSEVKAKKKHNKPSQKARVAGTDYQCAWCPEKILNVDAYISRFRRGPDGQWQHDRLHAECDIASQEWFGEYPFDEFTPHMFRRGTCTEAI